MLQCFTEVLPRAETRGMHLTERVVTEQHRRDQDARVQLGKQERVRGGRADYLCQEEPGTVKAQQELHGAKYTALIYTLPETEYLSASDSCVTRTHGMHGHMGWGHMECMATATGWEP